MSEQKKDNLQEADGKEKLQNSVLNQGEPSGSEVQKQATDAILNEINQENAEEAEDLDHKKRHEIPMRDYEAMDLDGLVRELKHLLRNEKIQAIKKHVEAIRYEFDKKYKEVLEEKKEEFLAEGGNELDFKYVLPIRGVFYELYDEYRQKKDKYQKELEQVLQANLAQRQDIISEIKGLINVEEDINTTFKHFKQLQEQWFKAGPVPRANYNDLWQNYHHHVEKFYDFVDLNRDLRDMDFKHNLEEKLKIVQKAEALAKVSDPQKAFRELQILHKIWKEDIGPVAREYREEIWHRFSEATKTIHEKRQHYFENLDKIHEENAIAKNEIIAKIKEILAQSTDSHNQWQRNIKKIDTLRKEFFAIGKTPSRVSNQIWLDFKQVTREFNRKKNGFYKNLKQEQQENLDKKLKLIEIAKANMDSSDWEAITPVMKKIQEEWRTIGHVPQKVSDKIWTEFLQTCNHYFDRMHQARKEQNKFGEETLEKKKAMLDSLKDFKLSGDRDKDVEALQALTDQWNSLGKSPHGKRNLDLKFGKITDTLYKKLNFDKQEIELIKYNNKLERLVCQDDEDSLNHELIFVRRKIEEAKAEVLQLENNLQFFSNVDEKNPLVREVIKNIENHKETLKTWEAKLRELRNLQAQQVSDVASSEEENT
ncbi:DUF349 domain-containing protein [Capnocytophaga canimorsus]|uniref:DUF349 domain-containing protein n=1 Tax=Capnocytophaga canimorsus TaxID=28188 RepID=UPI0037D54661